MKNYPFRYPEELEKDIDYLKSLWSYGGSKNRVLQDAVQIAAASVKKLMWGHAKDEQYQKVEIIRKELKLNRVFGRGW